MGFPLCTFHSMLFKEYSSFFSFFSKFERKLCKEEAIQFLQEKVSGFYEVLNQIAANEYFVLHISTC